MLIKTGSLSALECKSQGKSRILILAEASFERISAAQLLTGRFEAVDGIPSVSSMNFWNVNPMNTKMNMISANLLPLTTGTGFSMIWWIYQAVTVLLEIIYTVGLIAGCIFVPAEKALQDATLCIVVMLETIIMRACLFTRRSLIVQVIGKINDILHAADEIMRDLVISATGTLKMPFAVYGVISVISIVVWTAQPIVLVLERNSFFYVDFNLPTAFSVQPFSSSVFALSIVVMTFGNVFMFLRKFSMDIYVMHLVLLLTAQYRYMATMLRMLFRDQREVSREMDRQLETKLKELCRHQNSIMQ